MKIPLWQYMFGIAGSGFISNIGGNIKYPEIWMETRCAYAFAYANVGYLRLMSS